MNRIGHGECLIITGSEELACSPAPESPASIMDLVGRDFEVGYGGPERPAPLDSDLSRRRRPGGTPKAWAKTREK